MGEAYAFADGVVETEREDEATAETNEAGVTYLSWQRGEEAGGGMLYMEVNDVVVKELEAVTGMRTTGR